MAESQRGIPLGKGRVKSVLAWVAAHRLAYFAQQAR
jgi:hypothetical protein